MKFTLSTSGYFYNDPESREELSRLGFTFSLKNKFYHINQNTIEIEINTLEELVEFTKKYGEIVFSDGQIEIYDDYRE